jgi:RNA polymerase sigma-70 factor (ECF subfamily)
VDHSDQAGVRDVFATTRWTVVLAAGHASAPQASVALEELCQTYWYPLYVYVRRQVNSREDAEDLTQAFFARFLEKNYLAGLQHEKGKFRAFLLAALKHFLANEWDRARSQKRGGGIVRLSLDLHSADTRFQTSVADHLSPDRLYDRAWAITLLERVISRLRAENVVDGRGQQFESLKPFLSVGRGEIPYSATAKLLGLSEGAIRVQVHRLRQRYRALLREEISQTLSDPTKADEEMQSLFAAFSNS